MKTYSVKEIADLLKTNPETVRRWIRDNKLNAVQMSRKDGNIVTNDELQRFIKATPKYLPKVAALSAGSQTFVLTAFAASLIANVVMEYYSEKSKLDMRVLPKDFEKYIKESIDKLKKTVVQKKMLIENTNKEIESLEKQIEQYQHLLEHDEIIEETIKKVIIAEGIMEE